MGDYGDQYVRAELYEQLKAENASLTKGFASQTARLATKIAENRTLRNVGVTLEAENARLKGERVETGWTLVSERLPTGEEPNGILLDVGDDVWFLMGHRARNKAEKDYAVCWFECPPSPTPQEQTDE